MKKVLLFGTSCDPPTLKGHSAIVNHLSDTRRFDEVRIMPVYRHMFEDKRSRVEEEDEEVRRLERRGLESQRRLDAISSWKSTATTAYCHLYSRKETSACH